MSTILVVDDMAVFREPIAASLRLANYQTDCAENGYEALGRMAQHIPDLILLDMAMPVMDGMAFLKVAKTDPRFQKIPIILLTAVSEKDYIIHAAKYGIKDYLLKSQFSIDKLLKRIQNLITNDTETASPNPNVDPASNDSSTTTTPSTQPTGPVPTSDKPPTSPTTPNEKLPDLQLEAINDLKSIKPILSRSEIQEYIDNCGELKGFSPTVAQILKLTNNNRCSIEQVANVIKQDHAIALKLLKLANSAIYTRGEPIDSVLKAVMRIGLSEIRQVVLNIIVVERFSSSEHEHINMAKFWEHSIACGLIATEIIRHIDDKDTQLDAAFTMGLLHDVGRMVYLEMLGEKYTAVMQVAKKLQLPLEMVESRMLLINHADAMDRILHAWKFPKDLIDPIAFHQLSMSVIRGQVAKTLNQVATLALANRLAHALLLGSSGNLALYPIEEFVNALRLDGKFIQTIAENIPSQTDDIKFALLANSRQSNWPQLHLELKAQLQEPFRPLFLSNDPDIDALRITCDRLRDTTEGDPPNIAVIHIAKGREMTQLSTKFKKLEKESEICLLPLLIVSPNGKLQLEPKIMAERNAQLLPYPVTLTRFINTIQAMCCVQPGPASA